MEAALLSDSAQRDLPEIKSDHEMEGGRQLRV